MLQPERVVGRLATELQLDHVDQMLGRVSVASGSSSQSDSETRDRLAGTDDNRNYLVERWRQRVDKDEESALFDVLDALGIDTYERGNPLPARPLA